MQVQPTEEFFYTTAHFGVFAPTKPHISREEGGHLCIKHLGPEKRLSRLDFTPQEAKEFIRLSMLVAESMLHAMKERGVNIARINYHESGNWSFLRHEQPFFHLHIYGRTTDSFHQPWGESLHFPDPSTSFYDHNLPLDHEDTLAVLAHIKKLEYSGKYAPENW